MGLLHWVSVEGVDAGGEGLQKMQDPGAHTVLFRQGPRPSSHKEGKRWANHVGTASLAQGRNGRGSGPWASYGTFKRKIR